MNSDGLQAFVTEQGDITTRYIVTARSDSGHCCFEASVFDVLGFEEWRGPSATEPAGFWTGKSLCECFDQADAETICAALNAQPLDDESRGAIARLNEHAKAFTRVTTPAEDAFRGVLAGAEQARRDALKV